MLLFFCYGLDGLNQGVKKNQLSALKNLLLCKVETNKERESDETPTLSWW